jgi:hypothetical protein
VVIRLVRTDDGALWDRVVATTGRGTAFHAWDWLQLAARQFGWRFDALVVEQDRRPVGVFPLFVEVGMPPHSVRPPFPYTGPLVQEEMLQETLRALRRWQLRHALPRVRFEFPPSVQTQSALESANCSWQEDATFVIPVEGRSEAELMAGMSRRSQRAVKKAAAAGVEIRASLPGEVADLLPRLFEEAWGVRGLVSPYPSSIAVELDDRIGTDARFHATTAVLEGRPIGVQVALIHERRVYCWGGGALRANRDQQPFTALAFDLFVWALRNGYEAVDMVGKVDEGVATFKRSLGGVEIPYLIAASTIVPSPAIAVVRALHERRSAGADPSQHGVEAGEHD